MKIVILAGGGGSRLWPLSREGQPKQFSKIIGEKTLFETTIDRFLPDFEPVDIYISVTRTLLNQARDLAPQIPERNFIIEPEKRDTAPAMGYIAAFLYHLFPHEPFVYVPSDHYIQEEARFRKMIFRAAELIRQTNKMLDIAIHPEFPSTVLGYTRIGRLFNEQDGIEAYEFLGHKEKPDFETAKKYLESGEYLWHANYYMWTPVEILEAFKNYSPGHYRYLVEIVKAFATNDMVLAEQNFCRLKKQSFDYAITEKIDPARMLILKGDFGWSDVGAFDVLYNSQVNDIDRDNNIAKANWVGYDTSNCLIYGSQDKLIATIGLDDLVIVDTEDALLVCRKGDAQGVKKIVQHLKDKGLDKYL